MTICWHVDDLFIGHKDYQAKSNIIQWLQTQYKTPDKPLQATCGSVNDYLRMNINFSNPGNVSFGMILYIKNILNKFPKLVTGVASTPAADHLFKICAPSDAHCLPESQAIAYHHTMAQLLFISQVCHNIQTAVAFLTIRVKTPGKDNGGKLKCVLKYLNGTGCLKVTLSAEYLSILCWYVDTSHQIHDDYHDHTGAILTFGTRVVTSSSNKQNSTLKVLQNMNLSRCMINQEISCGHIISLRHKAT